MANSTRRVRYRVTTATPVRDNPSTRRLQLALRWVSNRSPLYWLLDRGSTSFTMLVLYFLVQAGPVQYLFVVSGILIACIVLAIASWVLRRGGK